MKPDTEPFVQTTRVRHGQRGQALIMAASLLIAFFVAAAVSIDFGFVYTYYQKMQGSAQAAAIAAASALPNWTLAQQYASLYSSKAGSQNVITGVTATMSVTYDCSQTLVTQFSLVCPTAYTSGSEQIVHANAIQIVEKASVPTFFAKMFGVNSIPITVTASARSRGNSPVPANVVVVAQATGHTGGVADPNCPIANWPNGQTKYQADCIKSGIRTILSQFWPCPSGQTCGSNNAVDEVSLMIFPGLKSTGADGGSVAQAAEYSGCNSTGSITPYVDENYAASSNPLFTVVPFGYNYRTSSTSNLLNGGASDLVQAVDWSGDGNGVPGNCSTGQYGYANIWETDYAPAINAAQASFATLPTSRQAPSIQNVIILVSDGDAPGQMGCNAGNNYCNGGGTAQCQQGVNAAKAAAAAGTTVYTIAYGANTSGTCSLDSGLQACTAMQDMAISPSTYPNPDPSKFFSDQGGQVGNCVSAANPSISSVTQIFQAIGVQLETSALILNSTY